MHAVNTPPPGLFLVEPAIIGAVAAPAIEHDAPAVCVRRIDINAQPVNLKYLYVSQAALFLISRGDKLFGSLIYRAHCVLLNDIAAIAVSLPVFAIHLKADESPFHLFKRDACIPAPQRVNSDSRVCAM